MSKRLVWQGSHDNFCGLYCGAEIIARFKTARSGDAEAYEDYFREAFFNLLKSAEDLCLLTAHRIASPGSAGGFSSKHITRIFNNMTPSKRAGSKAISFSDPIFKAFASSTKPKDRFAGPACAIVKEDGDRHWIAAVGLHRDAGYHCWDPDRAQDVKQRERLCWNDGVFITNARALEV